MAVMERDRIGVSGMIGSVYSQTTLTEWRGVYFGRTAPLLPPTIDEVQVLTPRRHGGGIKNFFVRRGIKPPDATRYLVRFTRKAHTENPSISTP